MMKNKKKIALFVLFAVLTFVINAMVSSGCTFAKTTTKVESAIADKAVFQGLYKCYTNGYIVSQLNSLNGYDGTLKLIIEESEKVEDHNYVPLVTGITSSNAFGTARYKVGDSGLSCRQLILGGDYVFGGRNQDILSAYGKTVPNRGQTDEVKALMNGMGYTVEKNGNDICYGLKYTYKSAGKNFEGNTNSVCVGSDGTLTVQEGGSSGARHAKLSVDGKNVCLLASGEQTSLGNVEYNRYCATLGDGGDLDGEWLMKELVHGQCGNSGNCSGFVIDNPTTGGSFVQESLRDYSARFDGSSSNAALDAVRFLSNDDSYASSESLGLTEMETRILYQDYLESYYGASVYCNEDAAGKSINWLDKTVSPAVVKKCKVEGPTKNGYRPVNGVNDRGLFEYESIGNYDALIDAIGKLPTSYTEEQLSEIESLNNSSIEGDDDTSIREMCDKAELNGQGWILCPAIENMTYTAGGIDSAIQWLLSIDTSMYDYDSGTYKVWQVMRSFANILMIIFLLFIIFSQITGFGIDNYGIKKMLPRLIVAAILINLSFVICMVAVDLSNIIGVGLRDLFGSIGSALDAGQEGIGQGFIDFAVQGLFVLGAAGTAAAPTIGAVVAVAGAAPINIAMMVIVILLALIGVLVAIFMFFISLSARMIIIILCVAVAPVAFALYVLPNTQNVFKRWVSAFKAALVVFPICGALGGISELIKGIARGTTDWVMLVIGLVAPFMVFFLLPSLLRNTLSAMGQIGSAFQALSQKVSAGWQSARGAVEKSGTYRDAMEQAKANKAKKIRDELNRRMKEETFARNPFERAWNESRYKTAIRRAGFNEVTQQRMHEDQLKYASEEDRANALASSIKANNIDRAIAAVNQMKANGQTAKAMEVLKDADLSGLIGNDRQRFAAVLQQSGSDPMVGYGIYLSTAGDGNKKNLAKSFKQYMSDTDSNSYAARLFDKGSELSTKLTKDDWKTLDNSDTIKHMADDIIKDKNGNPIYKTPEEQKVALGNILGAAAAQGRKLKDDHRGFINQAIKDSGLSAGMLNWSPEQLTGLRLDTVQKLEDNYEGDTPEVRKQKLLSELAPQIGRMASDNRIRNRMDPEVLKYFGIQANNAGSGNAGGGK